MWIISCFLVGSLASSLQGVNETVSGIPTTAPSPAPTSTPLSRLLCVWLSAGSVCLVVLLFLLVLLVRKYVYDKSETDPTAGQSTVTTDDVNYAEIIIKDNGNNSKTREFGSEPEVIYSTVK